MRFLLWGGLILGAGIWTVPGQGAAATSRFDGQSWWAHVKVLADDNMEGRETGSAGLRRAQAYVVEQAKQAGLEPAGTDGYYQKFLFTQRQVDEANSSAGLVSEGKTTALELGPDAYFGTRGDGSTGEIMAPLVFIGNGLRVPELKHDDLAGLDVKGKIVVYLTGSPEQVPGSLSAHYGGVGERWKVLREAGAIGYIAIPNPSSMDVPWIRSSANRLQPAMDLADPVFNETAGLKLAMTFNPAQAEKLFVGSGHTFQEIAVLGKERKLLPRFPLKVALKAKVAIKETTVESANIVARLPGSDPALKAEHVVFSAHLDHLGIGAPINGDRVYNGAMDDASGCALLLDLAAQLHRHPEKLRRSVLFVFVCAEEKGLLGSKYFSMRPTVDARSLVADINTDMFLPIVPLKVLRILGISDSDLGDQAVALAKAMGIKPIPDPEPLRNLFVRSDQYNFIRQGIPAIKLDIYCELGTPEEQIYKDWRTQRYHAPSDDLQQPVDLASAALYEEFILRFLVSTANADARPQWKADSFFRRFAK